MIWTAPNDQRLSRRPTEGRPVGSKRRLGCQLPSPEAPQVIRPTPPPAHRRPACYPQDGKSLSLRLPDASGDSGWAYPPPANFPPPGASFKAPTSRLPAVPAACSAARYPASPRPPLGLSPKGTERFRTAIHPIGAPFPQRPLPHQPPASFPPRAREPRPRPERAPRSLPADSRADQPPTTGRSATPTGDPSTQTSPALSPDFGPGMTHPPPPARGKSLPPLPATASRGCRNDHSRQAFHSWRPNGMRLSRCAERAKRAERSRLEARVSPPPS